MRIDEINDRGFIHAKRGQLEYIQFKNLLNHESALTHCFTTRKGGVSTGECQALNMGFNKKDDRSNVEENYRRLCRELEIEMEHLVFSNQVHEDRVRAVDEGDRGKGITRESDIKGYDGLMTDRPGVALVTFYADCVPIFLFDPVRKAIALSHSGWRGTVKEIGKVTVEKMTETYGCKGEDIIAAVGPSIGACCFEAGDEVYSEFAVKFPWNEEVCRKTGEGKWHINLQETIKRTLLSAGVKEQNISISGICTKCNKDLFFSHRGDKGRTGSLAAIMQLKQASK